MTSDNPPRGDSHPPNRSDSAVCGKKFQTMLTCVEKSGAVSACTEKINDFLACERTVFRAALRKAPSQPSATEQALYPSSKQPTHVLAPRGVARTEPAPENESEDATFDLFRAPWSSMERVVRKQMGACTSLIDTIGRPNYQTQLLQFNRRMITDMRVTCEIIRSKTVQLVEQLFKSAPSDDQGKPSQR